MKDLILSLRGISKNYTIKNSKIFPVLRHIDLDIESSELLVLLGPSGSGKSTLLHVIAGLKKPDTGIIIKENKNITNFSPNKRNLSLVFQNGLLYPHMSVWDNLAYPLKIQKLNKKTMKERIISISDLLDIQNLWKHKPHQLSGGQQQRVSIAKALVKQSQLYLFDEPFAHLDIPLRENLCQKLKNLHQKLNFSAIYVTHNHHEAMLLGSRVAVLNSGVITQIGTPNSLYKQPKTLFVANIFRALPINILPVISKKTTLYLQSVDHPLISLNHLPNDLNRKKMILMFRSENIYFEQRSNNEFTLEAQIIHKIDYGYFTLFSAILTQNSLTIKVVLFHSHHSDEDLMNKTCTLYINTESTLIYDANNSNELLGTLHDFT